MGPRQRTKIIATLGDPHKERTDDQGELVRDESGAIELETTYKKGIFDLQLRPMNEPDIERIIRFLLEHGADLVRINLAHIRTELIDRKFGKIKQAILKAEAELGRKVGVLVDLPGPKIRLPSGNLLLPTETLVLSFAGIEERLTPLPEDKPIEPEDRPRESILQVNLGNTAFEDAGPAAKRAVERMERQIRALRDRGETVLAFIGDNEAMLQVLEMRDSEVTCRVVSTHDEHGALLGTNRGFTIRNVTKDIEAFTLEDQAKLDAVLTSDHKEKGSRIISHIGISFCQTREDARRVQQHLIKKLAELGGQAEARFPLDDHALQEALVRIPMLIAKIETKAGVENISRILDIADGAMIARGDLALEIETTDLPERAKELILHCNLRGKPVIMATKMLESMQSTIECSRSEATDVFEAVADSVDALLLSGETSSGKYPAHALAKMRALALNAERYVWSHPAMPLEAPIEEFQFPDDPPRPQRGSTDRTPEGDFPEQDEKVIQQEEDLIQGYYQKLRAMKLRTEHWRERWTRIAANYAKKRIRDPSFQEAAEYVGSLSTIKTARLDQQDSTDRISLAACMMSTEDDVAAIVAPTTSGRTVRMLARFRPPKWILALPHTDLVARKLSIDRGVRVPRVLDNTYKPNDFQQLDGDARAALAAELAGKAAIFACGIPLGSVGTTNLIHRWEKVDRRSTSHLVRP